MRYHIQEVGWLGQFLPTGSEKDAKWQRRLFPLYHVQRQQLHSLGHPLLFFIANKPVSFLKTKKPTFIKEGFDELSFMPALDGVAISPEANIPGRNGGISLQIGTSEVLKVGTGFENVRGALDSQEQGGVEYSKGVSRKQRTEREEARVKNQPSTREILKVSNSPTYDMS